MTCNHCGSEIQDNDKFCSNCGRKVEDIKTDNNGKKPITISFNKFIIIIIILAIIIIALIGLFINGKDIEIGNFKITNLLKNNEITDEYLTANFKGNGFEAFEYASVKALSIKDIEYNNYNKLVMANIMVKSNNNFSTLTGLLLVNREEDLVRSWTIDRNIVYLFTGISTKEPELVDEITNICVKYVQNNGIEFFNDRESDAFKLLIKEISDLVGIEKSREIITDEYKKYTSSITTDYFLLFEKDSALIKYMAFPDTISKYNPNYPMDEKMYEYLASSYSNRNSLNAIEYAYGPAYIQVDVYSVIPVKENAELLGYYNSLEDIIKELDVEILEKYLDNINENKSDINDESKTEVNGSSNENNQLNDNNKNDYQIEIEEEEPDISINDIDAENMSFEEVKTELESRGLKVEIEEREMKVPYIDEKANKEHCIIYYNIEKYKKGDTVTVTRTKYVSQPIEARFTIAYSNISWKDDLLCMLDKDSRDEGVKVYFDDKLVATFHSDDTEFNYTFTNEKSVKVKIIAPYLSHIDNETPYEQLPIEENVTISEYTLDIKEASLDEFETYELYR